MEEPLIPNNIIKKDEPNQKVKNLIIKNDAYLKSNFLSKIFFFWAYRIIRLANLIPLKNEYLGKLEGKHTSEIYERSV